MSTLRTHSASATPHGWRPLPLVVVLLAALVGACAGSSTPRPTIPPGATGSLIPAAIATAPPASSASAAAAFPLTLTDDEGTKVEIKAEPAEIVSLTPGVTETLYAIGAGNRLVGKVDDIANFPAEAKDVPVVGTFDKVDVEKIVALGTDLVIAGGNRGTPPASIEKLRSLGVPVLVLYAADVDGVFHDIELTGQAVGKAGPAIGLAATMRAGFADVAARMASVAKPRIFYETGDQPAIFGVADKSFVSSMIELAGGAPITTGSSTSWEQSIEKLVQADPELILLGDAAYGMTADAVARRPGWAGITAVKARAIRPVDDIVITRPGPRLLTGLRLLVAAIHPEIPLPSTPAPASAAPSGG